MTYAEHDDAANESVPTYPAGPDGLHERPHGVTDAEVLAVGKLTEALETVERARGHLYDFHQLCGSADAKLAESIEQLYDAGHPETAQALQRDLLGRNVAPDRWSFQLVEEYDDGYWSPFREHERAVRTSLLRGRRHVAEAEMKERERSRPSNRRPSMGTDAG